MSSPFGGFVPTQPEPEIVEGVFEEVAPVVPPAAPEGVAEAVPVDAQDTVLEIEAALDDEVTEYRQQLGLITPVVLSKILGIHPDTLKGWRGEGKGPNYLKIGKRVWYHYSMILEWLPTRRVRTAENDTTEKGLRENADPERRPEGKPDKSGAGSGDAPGTAE